MSLLLGHSFHRVFRLRAPASGPSPRAWLSAMSKRPASPLRAPSPVAELGPAPGAGAPAAMRLMASGGHPNKRRRLQPVSAVPPAAPATTVAPAKAAQPAAKAPAAKAAAAKVDENGMWLIVGLGNPGANYDDTRHKCVGAVLGRAGLHAVRPSVWLLSRPRSAERT